MFVINTASAAALMLVLAGGLAAQAAPPKGATGQCTDGSYTTAKTQERACTKHAGVKSWFAAAAAPAPSAPKSAPPSAAPPPPAAVVSKPAKAAGAPPKGSTAECTDGSYSSAKTQERACTKHGGVKTWLAGPATAAAPTPPAVAPAPPAARAVTPAAPARPAQAPPVPGQVWVNTATKVYHCPGTKYYGTTKAGKYMSEADAKAAGVHGERGKSCS